MDPGGLSGFSGSSRYTSPLCLGGKGICWQEVATQGSRTAGDQVWFQAHTDDSSSYKLPSGAWKLP